MNPFFCPFREQITTWSWILHGVFSLLEWQPLTHLSPTLRQVLNMQCVLTKCGLLSKSWPTILCCFDRYINQKDLKCPDHIVPVPLLQNIGSLSSLLRWPGMLFTYICTICFCSMPPWKVTQTNQSHTPKEPEYLIPWILQNLPTALLTHCVHI